MPIREQPVCCHPPVAHLEAFERGDLPAEEIADVEGHLLECVDCCDALDALPADAFLSRLREAHAASARGSVRPAAPSAVTPPPTVNLAGLPASLPSAPPGTPALSGFEDVRELGRGGMGVVYAATHAVMGRRVAVKLIHPEFAANAAAVERFRREARAVARLTHPNLVTAYDAGQDGDRPFLVMEYLDGESLADRVERDGPLPLAEACDGVRQAALGLQYAHDNGLVHRDVKPHNLMRTGDGTVKVLDFGLAALANDGGRTAGRTGPNAVMGTPDYMAPEQAEDARSADGRADVYGLGCTLFHLLTGKVPFPMDSTLLKLLAHRTQDRPSARDARPDVPAPLDAVLRKAMARRPEERYPTPGALAAALEPFADPACVAGLARRNRRRTLAALAALLLVAATVAAGVTRLPAGKDHEIVIETDDAEVEVVVKGDRVVRIVDPKTGRSYRLDREELTLSLVDEPDGLAVTLDGKSPVVLKRHGKRIATVRLEPAARPRPPEKVAEKRPEPPFNGKDLTGWVVDGGRPGSWRVEDGELVGTAAQYPDMGWLLTERSYTNFRLRFEYHLSAGANSGVALRAVPGEKNPGNTAFASHLEVQILDDNAHRKPDGSIPCATGTLFWAAADSSYLRPDRLADLETPGSWNEMTIESRGASLQVWVNGRPVLRTDLDQLAKQSNALPGLQRSSGRIGFQRQTGSVRFRNIEIRELPPPQKAAEKRDHHFFNGKDLTGWVGLPGYWHAEDGALVGSPPGGRGAHTFLVSEKKYRDFDLKFQARRLDGVGNSGVQFRSRLADAEAYTVVGPQCEIDSAGHTYPPGSLLTEPDLKPLAEKAPRTAIAAEYKDQGFNDFHIRCVGKHVTIKVNGVTAIDDDYPELPDEGVIAWQINGWSTPREVRFRNIEFTDLSEGFKPLPLSKGLPDWVIEGDDSRFRREGDVLVATSPHWKSRGYLLREGQYANYRLRFQCRLEEGANCGVVVRGFRGERSDFEQPGAIDHPVIKLTDAKTYPNLPSGSTHWVMCGNHSGPFLWPIDFPIGEWNTVEIEVKGATCQMWVNKVLAVSLKLDEANRSGQLLAGLAREKGHIGFQANVGTARFRNVEIKELP